MSRMTIDKARRSTDMFSLRRFGGAGTTKESRHRAWLAFRTEGVGGSDTTPTRNLLRPWTTASSTTRNEADYEHHQQ